MLNQDYIERLIARFVEGIGRALGLARSGRENEAQDELDALWTGAIGLRRGDVDRLDASTLRSLLGAKRAAAAVLLDGEAEMKQALGDPASASRLRALAAALRG